MASLSRNPNRPEPVMNVTPLVDVVLVLLIIFMIVIPNMDQGAQIELPSVFNVDEDAKSKTDPFMLAIEADGDLFFEEERLEVKKLEARLREANRTEPARRLMLRADRKARYQDARRLFAIAQGIGFPGVSLRVNEAGDEPGEGR
ncbi:MAG: ExbD/TolR family protein [Myxococcota bacterium]